MDGKDGAGLRAALLERRSEAILPTICLHDVSKKLEEEEHKQSKKLGVGILEWESASTIRSRAGAGGVGASSAAAASSSAASSLVDGSVLEESKHGEPAVGTKVLFAQALCAAFALVLFLPAHRSFGHGSGEWTSDGTLTRVCPRSTLCAEGTAELALLVVSRTSAFVMWPPLVVLFWSKFRASATFLSKTVVSLHFPLAALHDLHALCGRMVCGAAVVHAAAHVFRWTLRAEVNLMVSTTAGLSGLVAFFAVLVVSASMGAPARLRKRCTWESRNAAHGFYWVMMVALCFHHWLLRGVLVVVVGFYVFDRTYVVLCMTELVEVSDFKWVSSGTLLTFDTPKTTLAGKGYVEILVPFLSTSQWHPFSVFPATSPGKNSVFIQASGDWSRALHNAIALGTTRPVWVRGPFVSPFDGALGFDNLVLVATGIGITPALATIERFRGKRRVALVWVCRDASLVEFFLRQFQFDEGSITLVFYTGKVPLSVGAIPKHVSVFASRPDLRVVLPTVIRATAERARLPSHFLSRCVVGGSAVAGSTQGGGDVTASRLNVPIVADVVGLGDGLEAGMGLGQKLDRLLLNCAEAGGLDERAILGHFEVDDRGMLSELRFYQGLRRLLPQGEAYLGAYHMATDFDHGLETSPLLPTDETADGRCHGSSLFEALDLELADGLRSATVWQAGPRKLSAVAWERKLKSLIGDAHQRARDILSSWHSTVEFATASTEAASRARSDASFLCGIGKDALAKNWCFLYCGGSRNVIEELEAVSAMFGPQLKLESFDW